MSSEDRESSLSKELKGNCKNCSIYYVQTVDSLYCIWSKSIPWSFLLSSFPIHYSLINLCTVKLRLYYYCSILNTFKPLHVELRINASSFSSPSMTKPQAHFSAFYLTNLQCSSQLIYLKYHCSYVLFHLEHP